MLQDIHAIRDVDGTLIGLYCPKHYSNAKKKIEAERFVERYKENDIYFKDGRYYPYWGASYYFLTLQDVRRRIDDVVCGIIVT